MVGNENITSALIACNMHNIWPVGIEFLKQVDICDVKFWLKLELWSEAGFRENFVILLY